MKTGYVLQVEDDANDNLYTAILCEQQGAKMGAFGGWTHTKAPYEHPPNYR